jgi:hypothetical protein
MKDSSSPTMNRRRVFAGAGTVGALAAAAAVLPLAPPAATSGATPEPAADDKGGYQLTAHVQRYYQTARV